MEAGLPATGLPKPQSVVDAVPLRRPLSLVAASELEDLGAEGQPGRVVSSLHDERAPEILGPNLGERRAPGAAGEVPGPTWGLGQTVPE